MKRNPRHVGLRSFAFLFFIAILFSNVGCTNPFNRNNGNAEPYSGFKAAPGIYYWLDDRVKCKTMDESGFRAVVEFRSEDEIIYRKACQSETVVLNSADVKFSPYGNGTLSSYEPVLSYRRGIFSSRAVKPTRKTIGQKAISWCRANQGGYRYDILVNAEGTIQKPVKARLIGVKSKFKKKELLSLESLGEVAVNVATTKKEQRTYASQTLKLKTENIGDDTIGTFTGTLGGNKLPERFDCVDTYLSPSEPEELIPSRLVSAGSVSACGTHLGKTFCWGEPFNGQLATGITTGMHPFPELTNVITNNVTQLSQGSGFGCAISGALPYCWGKNSFNELGRGASAMESTPAGPIGLGEVTAISAGSIHACAVSGGKVYCWGNNYNGQIGIGTISTTPEVPSVVTGSIDAEFTSVAAGAEHTCAATITGEVYCWGQNSKGQLGLGTASVAVPLPQKLPDLSANSLSAAGNATCAVTTDGKVKCWGDNTFAQVSGNGSDSPYQAGPTLISGLTGTAQSVSMGGQHACAVQEGQVFCWGMNSSGELGRSVNANFESIGLTSIADATAVSCGTAYTLTTTIEQTLGYGSNMYGQLGTGNFLPSYVPTPVLFP